MQMLTYSASCRGLAVGAQDRLPFLVRDAVSVTVACARSFSDKSGDGGILSKWNFFSKGEQAADDAKQGAAEVAEGDSTAGALVPSGPESKHRKVFVVELTRKPLFPGIFAPVVVSKNERLVREVYEAKKAGAQAYVGAFLKRSDKERSAAAAAAAGGADPDAADHLHEVGTFAQVHTILTGDNADSANLLLLGHRRIRRTKTVGSDPLKVAVAHLKDQHYHSDDHLKALSMEVANTMRDLMNLNPLYGEQFKTLMQLGTLDLNDPSRLADAAASLSSADEATLQAVLEQLDVPARCRAVLEILKKDVELCKLQADIREQVESKIVKEQRRMLLMEQLKSIKKELGLEKDDKTAIVQRFRDRFEPLRPSMPDAAATAVQDELDKLSGLEPVSPEFNVTRNYLEWLTGLPWGTYTDEIFDIEHGRKVLDEDHYGLDDVKARILEFIAVSRLRGSAHGKIICLVGPPGVGKTSVGRSIARTLNRKYYRFSVGGLYDVAEIKGHRRTYVGAMPGKMVQCLKHTGSSNPLVLIDEIDKLGRGHAGDPASALLELLDPEQNTGFVDHYLDLPIDLSKVLFMCTANVLDTIPGPLLDRMEVIRISGYASDEKRSIARTYLEPAAAAEAGVPAGSTQITDGALALLIDEHCREAGVRNLKKQLEKIYRKAAFQLVQRGAVKHVPVQEGEAAANASTGASTGATDAQVDSTGASDPQAPSTSATAQDSAHSTDGTTTSTGADGTSSVGDVATESGSGGSEKQPEGTKAAADAPATKVVLVGEPVVVDEASLKDFVGQPPFAADRIYAATPPGVVMGLAWTSMGGATLYVEAAAVSQGEGKASLITTGQLGDVFRESASIAHTYCRSYLRALRPASDYFDRTALHLHVPAGATPKDGPSAGCTIITALLSLALNTPVVADLAMTGEVTLTGKVLPIGGVKEKVLAARRSGVRRVLFPEGNRKDYEELSAELRAGLEPHFVAHYDDVFRLAFEGQAPQDPERTVTAAHATPAVAELVGGAPAAPATPAAA